MADIRLMRRRIAPMLLLAVFALPSFAEEGPVTTSKPSDIRELTIQGTIDTRLYAWVRSVFRPTKFDNEEACLTKHRDWATGNRDKRMKWTVADILPDAAGRYKVTVPLDLEDEDHCEYEYVRSDVRIRRDKDDGKYARLTIADATSHPEDTIQGHESGFVGWIPKGYKRPVVQQNHFQISSGSRITCFTEYYINSGNTAFVCFPQYKDAVNGIDAFESATIELDIGVEEERCITVGPARGQIRPDRFRDYEKQGLAERLWQGVKGVFD